MTSLHALEELVANVGKVVRFGKATFNNNFSQGNNEIAVKAGIKILTNKRPYHNKLHIIVKLSRPERIVLIEVAVAHTQDYRLQKRLKRTNYLNRLNSLQDFPLSVAITMFRICNDSKLIYQ